MSKSLSHFNSEGRAHMVDVSPKNESKRSAIAVGEIFLGKEVIVAIKSNQIIKGDALTTAKIAGIMAAKKTSDLIPMCHPLKLDFIDIRFEFLNDEKIGIESEVTCSEKTGVEMEAIVATTHAAITLYDMCKAMNKKIQIQNIHLKKKTGGVSGDFYFDG